MTEDRDWVGVGILTIALAMVALIGWIAYLDYKSSPQVTSECVPGVEARAFHYGDDVQVMYDETCKI